MNPPAPKELKNQTRQVDERVKQMERALTRWMLARGRKEARDYSSGVISKAAKWTDEELVAILMRFGLAQTKEAALRVASSTADIEQLIDPQDLAREIRSKDTQIVFFQTVKDWAEERASFILEDTKNEVRDSVNRLIEESMTETPRPSTGEIARRIRTQYHGDAGSRMFAFSPERAALIARTEMAQAENKGTFEGYKIAGVKMKRWLSYRDGRSGDRQHNKMHNVTIPIGDKFETPLGNRLMYPGDSSAPIKETANCRCGMRAVIVDDGRSK